MALRFMTACNSNNHLKVTKMSLLSSLSQTPFFLSSSAASLYCFFSCFIFLVYCFDNCLYPCLLSLIVNLFPHRFLPKCAQKFSLDAFQGLLVEYASRFCSNNVHSSPYQFASLFMSWLQGCIIHVTSIWVNPLITNDAKRRHAA